MRHSAFPSIAGSLWFIIAALLATMNVATVFAPPSNDTDTAGVSVSVNNQTIINIVPSNWTISAINPGSAAVNTSFNLENLGSSNITLIWASVSQPTANPFGGSASGFNAGNYIALRNYTGIGGSAQSNFQLIDTIEFNESTPSYITTHSSCSAVSFGKIRNASSEYFWCVIEGGSGNFTNGTLRIANNFHSDTQLGTTNLNTDSTAITISASGAIDPSVDEVTGTIPGSHPLGPACVRLGIQGGSLTVRYFKWNADLLADCTDYPYIFTHTDSNRFGPGQILPLDIAVFVPYGASAGSMSMGILTITAQ